MRPCTGTEGLAAVFVRSVDVDHVLHALGGWGLISDYDSATAPSNFS